MWYLIAFSANTRYGLQPGSYFSHSKEMPTENEIKEYVITNAPSTPLSVLVLSITTFSEEQYKKFKS